MVANHYKYKLQSLVRIVNVYFPQNAKRKLLVSLYPKSFTLFYFAATPLVLLNWMKILFNILIFLLSYFE